MTNIPTDLLRTFVSVVDLRSFTRAAAAQGVTQPAVSAQIKRLQCLLATDLLDKSSPGVCLTPAGEIVVSQARRLLSINDQILTLTGPQQSERVVRIGVPRDCIRPELAHALATIRARVPEARFVLRGEPFDVMIRELRRGELDVVFANSIGGTNAEARDRWSEQMVWIRGPSFELDPSLPVPLVSFNRECGSHRAAVDTLEKAGRAYELVLESPNASCLNAALLAGMGIMASASSRVPSGLVGWRDEQLPTLPDVLCGVYVGDGEDTAMLEQVADALAALFGPSPDTDDAARTKLGGAPAKSLVAAGPSI
jgi:DNA-binding transcriptional LysR family regulator